MKLNVELLAELDSSKLHDDNDATMKTTNNQEQTKFSAFFETFADKIPEDLWLNKIHIVPNHSYMSIEGYALSPSLVSFFIHQLTNNKLFGNQTRTYEHR